MSRMVKAGGWSGALDGCSSPTGEPGQIVEGRPHSGGGGVHSGERVAQLATRRAGFLDVSSRE